MSKLSKREQALFLLLNEIGIISQLSSARLDRMLPHGLTVAQFSFWGNYLPGVYPLHLRGTGESFAANVGGRMIGTPFAYLTQVLAVQTFVPGATPMEKLAYVAAGVAGLLFLLNFLLSYVLPEPTAENIDS